MGLLRRLGFGTDETAVQTDGLSGRATIVTLHEGGPYVNQRPTITMDLDVEVPGGAPYRCQAMQQVGRLVIGRLAPGVTIPVLIDPDDATSIVVDETAMLSSPAGPQ